MQTLHVVVESPRQESFRVAQVMGMFDLPADAGLKSSFSVQIPSAGDNWNIGVIVGPSGSGKTTIARAAFKEYFRESTIWPADRSILDGFPEHLGIQQITRLLGSVGFSSPPAWVRPFHLLSNGEQFRVNLARAIAEFSHGKNSGPSPYSSSPRTRGEDRGGGRELENARDLKAVSEEESQDGFSGATFVQAPTSILPLITRGGSNLRSGRSGDALVSLAVIDEFTSLVDRTVARIGSVAISRAVRDAGGKLVAVTCHADVLPWLEPDWVLDMADRSLQFNPPDVSGSRRLLRRPDIHMEIFRTDSSAWRLFERHHYLTNRLHPSAQCFVGMIENQPAAFVAAIPFPHPIVPGWREHRCVCLPDFQGMGIGSRLSESIAAIFSATRKPYTSVTSHPAMIHHRSRSHLWRMIRPPSRKRPGAMKRDRLSHLDASVSARRMTASFRYIGPPAREAAEGFGYIAPEVSQ